VLEDVEETLGEGFAEEDDVGFHGAFAERAVEDFASFDVFFQGWAVLGSFAAGTFSTKICTMCLNNLIWFKASF